MGMTTKRTKQQLLRLAEQQLQQLVAQHGPGLLNKPRRLKALLRDLFNKREARLLAVVVKEGHVGEILRDNGNTPTGILLSRLATQLYDELGIDKRLAHWSMALWAKAFGLQVAVSASPRHGTVAAGRPGIRPHSLISGRYMENGDGTVTDTRTGLMWMQPCVGQSWKNGQVTGEPAPMDWDTAMQQNGNGFAGYCDWRLPNIEELKALVYCSSGKRSPFHEEGYGGNCLGDYQRPTIDMVAFPNTPDVWLWSSSPHAGDVGNALVVTFSAGNVHFYGKGNIAWVRLVRAVQ